MADSFAANDSDAGTDARLRALERALQGLIDAGGARDPQLWPRFARLAHAVLDDVSDVDYPAVHQRIHAMLADRNLVPPDSWARPR